MKAVLMTAVGGPDVLQVGTLERPSPGPGELLVRVAAAGVNPLDTKVRSLHMFHPGHLPAVLGCDGAGTVAATGDGVHRFRPGDEVYYFDKGLGGAPGSYAEYTVVHEDHAAAKPGSLSMVEAAAVPLVLITAWEALVDRVGLRTGETALIHAGAGGVGHVAIQLARHLGARVATTVGGPEKTALAEALGAERVIDYRARNFVQETLDWTGGAGADVVLDTLGGKTFCESFGAVRPYGRLATLLSTVCEMAQVNAARQRNLVIGYVQMTAPLYLNQHEQRRRQTRILEAGARLIDEGRLKVVVGKVFGLEDAAAAHAFVQAGHATGKVVLEVQRGAR